MSSFRKRSALNETKALGRIIGRASRSGRTSELDGDGDGFITGPDGQDNIPAPVAKASEAVQKVWDAEAKKQIETDEKRAIKAAQAAKKRPPRFKLEQVADAMTRARRRDEVSEARAIAKGFVKSLLEIDDLGNNGEYKSKVSEIMFMGDKFKGFNGPHPEMHIVVEGQILDKDNNPVGLFRREIYLDSENRKGKPYIYHDMLRLTDGVRGKGIGADFTLASEAKYNMLGIDEIHLNAGLTDGAYTWSRAGYKLINDKERERFTKEIRRRLEQMQTEAGGIDKLIAGDFLTDVGKVGQRGKYEQRRVPKNLLKSREEYDTFVMLLDEIAKGNADPAVLTAFPNFAKFVMSQMNVDMKKPVSSFRGTKTLSISGFDKILRVV